MSDDLKQFEGLVRQAKSECSGFVLRAVDRWNAKIRAFQSRFQNAFSLMRGWVPLDGKTFYNAFHVHWINHDLTPEAQEEIQRFVDEINETVRFMEHANIEAAIVWRDMALSVEMVAISVFDNMARKMQTAQEIVEQQSAFLKEEIKIEVQGAEGSA